MGKCLGNPGQRLAIVPAAQGGASFSGIIRHDHREPLVFGASPERGFAAAGMADDRHVRRIDARLGGEVVHRPAGSPRPGCEGAPGIAGPGTGGGPLEQPDHAVAKTIFVVGREVGDLQRGDAVSARDQIFHRPEP